MRTALVVLHASSGVVGILAGLLSLAPPRPGDGRTPWRRLYTLCIAVLLVGLAVLIAYDWADLDLAARLAFSGLAGLGLVMALRLFMAHRAASSGTQGWQGRYIGHVYFTYVSLWVGLLIVPAINSPVPQVAVPVVVIAVLTVGAVLISRYKRRVLTAQTRRPQ